MPRKIGIYRWVCARWFWSNERMFAQYEELSSRLNILKLNYTTSSAIFFNEHECAVFEKKDCCYKRFQLAMNILNDAKRRFDSEWLKWAPEAICVYDFSRWIQCQTKANKYNPHEIKQSFSKCDM